MSESELTLKNLQSEKKKKAETRKRTACMRIGRKPKVKYKRCLAEIRRNDVTVRER
jgi:hypothetical protein